MLAIKRPKIFKKLSLFDIALISLVVILLLGFFFFFFRRPRYIQVRVKVTDQDVLYASTQPQTWYANRFEVGDVERDALGRIITEITGLESFNVSSVHKAVYLDLRLRATYDTRTNLYSVKGKNLVFGTPLRFNFSKIIFDGIVTEFPGSEHLKDYKVGTAEVMVHAGSIEPWIATAVKKGDKIYDSNGVLLAEVMETVVTPALVVTTDDRGDLLIRYDPIAKDLLMKVKIKSITWKGERFVFDNWPLKVSEQLPLNFEHISISPVIIEIVSYQFLE